MKDSELRMIETMLKKQDELNSAIMKEFGLTTISKEQIDLATLDEIGEFTHELKGDWCWWKKSQEPVDRNKALEELADVFHFVLIYELFYGKREYFSDSKYNVENPRNYMPVVQMDIAYGIASTKLGIETYRKLLINREALKLFVDWAEECDFGYDQLPDEYEKYQKDLEEKGLDYCEGLRYIAIQEAKEALETYHNKVKIMDEKLDEWEQGERK